MKYRPVLIATGLAIMALMGNSVKADEAEDLLNQLATLSKSGNTDGSTENLVKTIPGSYRNYMQQITDLANGNDSPAENPADQMPAVQNSGAQADPAKTAVTPSQPLQINTVQASGPLKEAHLAGYPALPDVPPVSSLTRPTAAQLQQKARTDWEQTRIQMYYFEHPGHSPN